MGFRLQRRVKIAPGLTLNISKRGLGLSAGPRGAKVSIGQRGTRETVGIPGTGMRYEVRQDRHKSPAGKGAAYGVTAKSAARLDAPPGAATIWFLAKAFKAPYEKEFIEGARCMLAGDRSAALTAFRSSASINPACADAELLASLISLETGDLDAARSGLERAVASPATSFPMIMAYLGADSLSFELAITDDVKATLHFDMRAAYLALAEIYQHQDRHQDAVAALQQAIARGLRDRVVVLSLAELYNDLDMDDELIAVAQGVANEDDVSVAIMFYLGQALARKGYYEGAVTVLKAALAKRKDRNETILMEVRYVLGDVYQTSGKKALARKQYEQILAKDYGYRDVKERLDRLTPAATPPGEA